MTKVELFNKFLEDSDAIITISFLFCKENYGLFFKHRNLACILSLVGVVPQYIEGREMPKLVPVDVRCPECDSIVSIRDNYCSDCGQALSFDFKEGH